MVPVGTDPLRVGILGNGAVETVLSECDGYEGPPIEAESVGSQFVDGENGQVHCVVVDGTASDELVDIVERCADERPGLPVLVLADPGDEQFVDALDAGATEALPARIADADPALLAEQVVEAVERERARTGFGDLYDGVAGGVTLHDPATGAVVDANDRFCETVGYSRDELRSMSLGEVTADVPGYDDDRAANAIESASRGDEALTLEWPFETADGTVRWTDSRLDTARLGTRELVVWCSTDVTERRRAEHAYEQVFDAVSDVISIHDPWAEKMVDVNETLSELTGYDRDALLEMGVEGVSAADEGYTGQRAYDVLQRVAATDDPETVEWVIETATGDHRHLEVNLTPATIAGDDRVLALSRDVTERQQLERSYGEVFEGVSDGLVVHDPDTGEITDVNERFCEMNGYDREELVGQTIDVVTGPDHEYERARELITAAREEGPQLFEWENQGADGETFPVEVHLSVVDIRGEEYVLASVRDITEPRERERELEEQRRLYGTLVEQSPNGVMIVQDKEIQLVNQQMEAITGEEEAALLGRPFYEIMTDEYRDLVRRRYEQRTRGEQPPQNYEIEIRTADGEVRIIDLHVSRIQYQREPATLATFDDVTERRRQERELRESERRFQLIADHIDEIIYLASADFSEILYINPAYEEIYGRSVEELSENPTAFVEAAHPDDREQYESDVERLIDDVEAGEPQDAYGGQYRIQRDGETRWVEVTRFPVEDDDGTVDRIVGRVADVTERVRREREYEQIFNSVQDAIVVHDPETGDMVDVNDTFCDLLGYDRETVLELGTPGFSVQEEGYTWDRAEDIIAEVLEEGQVGPFEWKVETKDGERRVLEVVATTAEIGGELRHVSINRDVTERKRREREYEQIFDGVNDAIVIQDPETAEPLDANQTFLDRLGYDDVAEIREAGLAGLSATEAGYTKQRAQELCQRVAETGEPETVEWQQETRDGERRWIEARVDAATIRGEERILSMQRDVTEQRRIERRLAEILDRIDEAIFMTRAEEITAASQAPDYVSSGYDEIWGQPLADLRDQYDEGFFATLHPDDEGPYRAFVEGIVDDIRAGEAAESYSREYRIERPDGETRWVHSDYYPTEWESRAPRMVIVSRDVTERKARERRIASFDDATDDLATADTPQEATRTAVDAATETLDLPAVGAFLYDDDDGVLRPEVEAGPLPRSVTDEPIGPGDGPLWEGFATGTVVASDGGEAESGFTGADDGEATPAALENLAEWRALALGNHGILLVGSPDGALGSEMVQAAHVLAATLEAALNHLEGQQRLAAQEEQLRTQTERAERLDRIARLTQQVEGAITEASNPGEVERAVCDRLASSGPYDLAWVGGLEVGSDRLVPHAVVGAADRYVDSLDLTTTDETADPHPAVGAWRTDEPQVADSLVGTGPAEDWRGRALSAGFQSLCAVPLTYDGVTHGVLTVGTDSPNAFGDRERDVIAQLGTSIANALAAIERRRALESDETVELEFEGSGESLSFARAADAADCRVRLERTVARQDGSVSVYFGFEGAAPDDAAAVATESLPGEVDVVSDESGGTLVEARTDDWFGSPLAEYGGVLREATADPGETTITVEVPQQADVRSFVERLETIAPSLELVARRQHRRQDRTPTELSDEVRSELTDRQFEVLQTALSAGYFEWPRENDGSEVADRLDITQPTLNKHLRLAEKQTFTLLFDDGA